MALQAFLARVKCVIGRDWNRAARVVAGGAIGKIGEWMGNKRRPVFRGRRDGWNRRRIGGGRRIRHGRKGARGEQIHGCQDRRRLADSFRHRWRSTLYGVS